MPYVVEGLLNVMGYKYGGMLGIQLDGKEVHEVEELVINREGGLEATLREGKELALTQILVYTV